MPKGCTALLLCAVALDAARGYQLVTARAGLGLPPCRSEHPLAVARTEEETVQLKAIEDCLVDATDEADLAACATEAGVPEGTIFTMQPRDDGWNDVREKLAKARDERAPAWNEIQEKYVEPASKAAKTTAKWTKVLAEEVVGAVDLGAGKEIIDSASSTLPKVLQVIRKTRENARAKPLSAKRKEAAQQLASTQPKPKPAPKPKAKPPPVSKAMSKTKVKVEPNPVRDAVSASANLGLIFASIAAVPAAILLYVVAPDTLKLP